MEDSLNIKFSENWSKLEGDRLFTTIRSHTDEKWRYYSLNVGKTFNILLNDAAIFKAKLIDVKCEGLKYLDEDLLKYDTKIPNPAIQEKWIQKIQENKIVIILFLLRMD